MNAFDKLLLLLRRVFIKIFRVKPVSGKSYELAVVTGQPASDLIKEKLLGNKPCMIARFGTGEMSYMLEYLNSKKSFIKYFQYVTGAIESYKYTEKTFYSACNHTGIFPATAESLDRFSELMLNDMKEVDIIGNWQRQEKFLYPRIPRATIVSLPDFEPYFHTHPWTTALRGRKVLVIHPFEETIQSQYAKREYLFENKEVLPGFELKTIKAVQSLASEETGFKDWFEALDHMKKQINECDFDIAIIGCGAYGFPLAAHVKRIGKKSVHMGGATQILFGIMGKRWEEMEAFAKFPNSYWTKASSHETPRNFKNVEAGCYW